MRLRRRPQHIRKAERLIEDAHFLIHHQHLGPSLLKARQAIDTLELALVEPPLTRLYSPELTLLTIERKPMGLAVTAVALVGYEHDWLAKILTDWLQEGFEVDGARVEFAHAFLEKIEGQVGVTPP